MARAYAHSEKARRAPAAKAAPHRAGPAARINLLEFLLGSMDIEGCARESLRWLGRELAVKRSLVLVFDESKKRLGGRLAFFTASARAMWKYNNQRVRLSFDERAGDATDLTINTVAVANGRYFGGGMHIAPEAELDDGLFDVIALGDMGLGDFILRSRRLYAGTHLTMDKVSHRRAAVVRAEPADPGQIVELDVDGETPGILPATFRNLPRAIDLIVPGDRPR